VRVAQRLEVSESRELVARASPRSVERVDENKYTLGTAVTKKLDVCRK